MKLNFAIAHDCHVMVPGTRASHQRTSIAFHRVVFRHVAKTLRAVIPTGRLANVGAICSLDRQANPLAIGN